MENGQDYVKSMYDKYCETKEDYLDRVYLRMKVKYKITASGCHEWTGTKNRLGYGLICFNCDYNKRTSMAAHRFIYWRHTKEDITNKVVMHTCDNPSCINPDHLRLGTYQDNIKDMWSKGRANNRHDGTRKNRVYKLTDEQVRSIRIMPGNLKLVAGIFGISIGHVSQIKNGKRKQLVL